MRTSIDLLAAFLDALCPLPTDGWRTESGAMRLRNADAPTMSDQHLRIERNRVSLRLALDLHPDRWLRERLAALDAEILTRNGEGGHNAH